MQVTSWGGEGGRPGPGQLARGQGVLRRDSCKGELGWEVGVGRGGALGIFSGEGGHGGFEQGRGRSGFCLTYPSGRCVETGM